MLVLCDIVSASFAHIAHDSKREMCASRANDGVKSLRLGPRVGGGDGNGEGGSFLRSCQLHSNVFLLFPS